MQLSFTVNESLFDVNPFAVMFSSNCTTNNTLAYSNPVMIEINHTRLNIGHCQYSIQLVDNNSQQIGYPLQGHFEVLGLLIIFIIIR